MDKFIQNTDVTEKIILGIPFYGQRWTGVEEKDGNHGLGSAVTPNYSSDYGIEYPKVVELMKNENYVQYRDGKNPYLYNATDKIFISYTDPEQIASLTALACDKKLGGVMTWEYGQDMTGTLLKAMYLGKR